MPSEARQWTLKTVRDRCDVIGDCWVWKNSVNSVGYPQASIGGKCGQMVRRFVFSATGRTVRSGYVLVTTCDDKRCCAPDHQSTKSRGTVLSESYRNGSRKSHSTYMRRLTANPLGTAKLSITIAREIRMSDEPGVVLAERHGVQPDAIYRIRSGQTWRDPANSVFAWRPSA